MPTLHCGRKSTLTVPPTGLYEYVNCLCLLYVVIIKHEGNEKDTKIRKSTACSSQKSR